MGCPDGLTLLTGGARSGKSDLAERLAARSDGPVVVIATAEPGDADMAARIARHRAARPAGWLTIEESRDLAAASAQVPDGAVLVVDCLTLWTANMVFAAGGEPADMVFAAGGEPADMVFAAGEAADGDGIAASVAEATCDVIAAVAARWRDRAGPTIVVTNEVGFGLHPATRLERDYRDLLGRVNRAVAGHADRTWLVVAGRVVETADPDAL